MQSTPSSPGWLLFVFSLPAVRATERVEVWRKLRRFGALQLPSSGYILPNTPENQEHLEWLAAVVRKGKGQASVIHASAIDDQPEDQLIQDFVRARSADYEQLLQGMKGPAALNNSAKTSRIRKRFEAIAAIDFFNSPLRSRMEAALARARSNDVASSAFSELRHKKRYKNRSWVTRPRPGIDRVSSAWLIRKFIDPQAHFVFSHDPKHHPNAVPFDMFQKGEFGHRGDDCTFETLRKAFGIRETGVAALAEMIHDADLQDSKFGRSEATSLDLVLIGWAQQNTTDEELLRRGIDLIAGLYEAISKGVKP